MAKRLLDLDLEEFEAENRPTGRNSLSSFAMYTQRKKYKEEVYPTVQVPSPIDLWYDKNKNYC